MIEIRQMALVESDASEPFEDRIDILFRELELAAKWQCSSLLLAVYSSEYVHNDAALALENRLLGLGQKAHHIVVKGEEDADIPMLISGLPDLKDGVIFVDGLRWGCGQSDFNIYHSLNKHREFFIENNIRVVFWLTESEAVNLAHYAPDYWTFRHRVIEFADSPRLEQIPAHIADPACATLDDAAGPAEDLDARITLRAALLSDLPESDESTSARANLLLTLGILHWRRGDYDQSVRFLNTALEFAAKLQDDRFEALCFNAFALVETAQENPEAAVRSYRRALELAPDQISPWNNLGGLYSRLGKHEEALAAYQKAVEQDPADGNSWSGLADACCRLGCHEDALFAYKKNLELNPADAHSWSALGEVYAAEGQLDDALSAFQKALELDPSNARLWTEVGNLRFNAAAYDEAAQACRKAIELDPGSEPSYNNLASIFIRAGNHAGAIPLLQKGIELQSEPARAAALWNQLGDAYRKLDDYENAMAAYRRADELEPPAAVQPSSEAATPSEGAEAASAPLPVPGPDLSDAEAGAPVPARDLQENGAGLETASAIVSASVVDVEETAADVETASATGLTPVEEPLENPAPVEVAPGIDATPVTSGLIDDSAAMKNETPADFVKWLESLSGRVAAETQAPNSITDAAETSPSAGTTPESPQLPVVEIPPADSAADARAHEPVQESEEASDLEETQPCKAVSLAASSPIEISLEPEAPSVDKVIPGLQPAATASTPAAATGETEPPFEGSRDFEEYLASLPSLSAALGAAIPEEESPAAVVEAPASAPADPVIDEEPAVTAQDEISLHSLEEAASNLLQNTDEPVSPETPAPAEMPAASPAAAEEPLLASADVPTRLRPVRMNVEREAVTAAEQAGFDSKSAQIWNELGNIYYNIVAYDEAINALNKAIELDHSYGWTYNNLASIYMHKGNYSRAVPLLQKGIPLMKNSKDRALLWNRLGDAYRRMDQRDRAAAAYKKAVELDPDHVSLLTRARFSLLGNCRA
jgi:tetratricopeptide (TPR) repeat protein